MNQALNFSTQQSHPDCVQANVYSIAGPPKVGFAGRRRRWTPQLQKGASITCISLGYCINPTECNLIKLLNKKTRCGNTVEKLCDLNYSLFAFNQKHEINSKIQKFKIYKKFIYKKIFVLHSKNYFNGFILGITPRIS